MSSSRQLAELIERLPKTLAAWNDRRAAQQGTTPARARLLQILVSQGPIKMNDLSRMLEVTPRNVTKLIDRLEQEGFVARAPHPHDRRATLVRATPQGLALLEQWSGCLADLEAAIHRLDPAEQATLRHLLEKLMQALQEHEG